MFDMFGELTADEVLRMEYNAYSRSLANMKEMLTKAHRDQTEIDAEINDLYHVIECVPLSGSQMMKVTVRLRKKLEERRNNKELRIKLTNIVTHGKDLNNEEKASATRTERYKQEAIASYKRLIGEL